MNPVRFLAGCAILAAVDILLSASAQAMPNKPSCESYEWGDLGNGCFANPILNADYSDPDVIRVGSKYYMTCSEFHFMGMPILESDDMVNWHIISRVHDSINLPGYDSMKKYGSGTWAPALRYHDGYFWIFVCTPDEGLMMTKAADPAGPWSPLTQVHSVAGWEDPCPLWDDNGNAFLGRSQLGGGPIYIHRMSPDGTRLLDKGVKIYEGPTAEGTKLFKKDGFYYLSIPEGGVGTGWQTVLRARDIYGPYEAKRVLETGSTSINGPHQGALVDTPEGEWWFYHFQSAGALGRVVHLQPVEWKNGFPQIGYDYDGNGIGEPMKICRKPSVGISSRPSLPQTDDNFDGSLGIQWQFNHNPEKNRIRLDERAGWLAIHPLPATCLREARNQLTQKLMGYRSEATTLLDFSRMKSGDRAGLECIGNKFCSAGIMITADGIPELYLERNGKITYSSPLPSSSGHSIWLRLSADVTNNTFVFSFSADGKHFTTFGEKFEMSDGDWKGVRTGIYAYSLSSSPAASAQTSPSCALFDFFSYTSDNLTENHRKKLKKKSP